MAEARFRPTVDHAVRTSLTTIVGLSEILHSEMFGPLGSKRYQAYAADIRESASRLRKLIRSDAAQSVGRGATRPLPRRRSAGLAQSAQFPAESASRPGEVARAVFCDASVMDLVGFAYEAGNEPGRWPQFLESLRFVLGAETAALLLHDRSAHVLRDLHVVGHEGSREPDLPGPGSSLDEAAMKRSASVVPGNVWTEAAIVAPGENAVQSRAGNGNDAPSVRHRMGGLVERNGSEAIILAVSRPRGMGPFESEEVALLETILPHVRKALDFRRNIGRLEKACEAFAFTFDRLPWAVMLVGSDGRPFQFNRRSTELLNAADGLTLGRDGLCAATGRETAALRTVIASAVSAAKRHSRDGGGALALSRPSGKKPLSVSVLPAPTRANGELPNETGPMAAIFVADPDEACAASSDDLRQFWQLTQYEARVAAMVAKRLGVEEIAAAMDITTNTVRTHLKHIFNKTQTAGQVELVHLILGSPAVLPRD